MSTNTVETTDAAAAAAGSGSASGATRLSLNVRTLDQMTYPISISSEASVPQLKEAVEMKTGIGFARQRLIFRGKVLKNDQDIRAYALEDGHTLHLVVRAENAVPPPAAPATATEQQPTPAARPAPFGPVPPPRSGAEAAAGLPTAARPRNNDEPDPTIGAMPSGRVLMGATISVPEGADVSMPFLNSMIANIMSSVQGTMVSGQMFMNDERVPNEPPAGTTRPAAASLNEFASRSAVRQRATELFGGARGVYDRPLGSRSRRRAQSAPRPRSQRGSSTSLMAGLQTLRTRARRYLDRVRGNMDNSEYDFANTTAVSLIGDADNDAEFLQANLQELEVLIDRFRTRMHLLPVALRNMQGDEQNQPLTATVRAIDTLQTIGEAADSLAQIARYMFIRHAGRPNAQAGGPEGDTGRISVSLSTNPILNLPTVDEAHSLRARRSSGSRRSSRQQDAANPPAGENNSTLSSLLERVHESLRGIHATLELGEENGATPATGVAQESATTRNNQPVQPSAPSSATADPMGTHISIQGMDVPLASVVVPISLTDLNSQTTGWNFASFANRLMGELPAATLCGILANDSASIHHLMAHIGFALASGIDLPRVSGESVRTWASTCVGELREQLRSRSISRDILAEVAADRQSGLLDELIRPLEPFLPEAIDLFFRATLASRSSSFAASSTEFFTTMARRFVSSLQAYTGGDAARLQRILTLVLVQLGVNNRLATFIMESFLSWADPATQTGGTATTSSRQRPREDPTVSGPEVKRQRQ